MSIDTLVEHFKKRLQETWRDGGQDYLYLKVCAAERGEFNLYLIGLAARRLAAEMGDQIRIEATIDGVKVWLEKQPPRRCQKLRLDPAVAAQLAEHLKQLGTN
jgi:hypothetical protein